MHRADCPQLAEAQAHLLPHRFVRHWSDQNQVLYHELEDTQELVRRTSFEHADPVFNKPLTQYVGEALSAAQNVGMHPYWAKLDVDVKRQLEKLLV